MKKETTHYLTTLATQKFKTTTIKVSFKAPLERETITSRNLLANVLRNSSMIYTSKKHLNAHLEGLYGANLSVSTKKQGRQHIISFVIQIANEKFLKSAPPLFEEALNVLKEILINPKVANEAFDEAVVALEKRLLKDEIESIFDDKTNYALKQLSAKMFEQETFGISGDGYIEDLEDISAKALYNTYQTMIREEEVEVIVLGDVVHEEVVKAAGKAFGFYIPMRTSTTAIDTEPKVIDKVEQFDETQEINQAKLNIGYRTHTRVTDEDYFSVLVFNGVFGAFAHSKLFMNVREKESLCYYCGSYLDNFKGAMYVYSGLDNAQIDKALNIIDKELMDVVNGVITEDELMMAKKSIINAKRESLDTSSGMMSDLEMNYILGLSAEEFIENIEKVTASDVATVAKKFEKDTIFILKPCTKESGGDA